MPTRSVGRWQVGQSAVRRSKLVLLLLSTVILPVSLARSFNARPADFWQTAINSSIAPGNLTSYFIDISSAPVTSKYVWTLDAGSYEMPPHLALINLTATLRIVGKGINTTFVHWGGRQRALSFQELSSMEFMSLTTTGMTLGRVTAATGIDTLPENLPGFYCTNVEWWSACDDLQCQGTDAIAQRAGVDARTLVYTENSDANVEYYEDHIRFPGLFEIQQSVSRLGFWTMNLFWNNLTVRSYSPKPDMENLYTALVAETPMPPDCWNANSDNLGFTYRGNISTANGTACLRWDDPSIRNNPYRDSLGNFTSVADNYCRNPRFFSWGPWCFTGSGPMVGQCVEIPVCPGTGPQPLGEGGSSNRHLGVKIGVPIAGGLVLAVLVLACVIIVRQRRREQRLLSKYSEVDVLSDKSLEAPRPWDIEEPFQSALEQPPAHCLARSGQGDTPPALSAYRLGSQMLAANVEVSSLDPKEMTFKYGPRWVRDNAVDTAVPIGVGAFGKVYAGLHRGAPAAFKVVNKLKPLDMMIRFVRKSVMCELQVQMQPDFPKHPHLLPLLDCVFYPPWWALLALNQGEGEHISTVHEAGASGSDSTLPNVEMVVPALDYAGDRLAATPVHFSEAGMHSVESDDAAASPAQTVSKNSVSGFNSAKSVPVDSIAVPVPSAAAPAAISTGQAAGVSQPLSGGGKSRTWKNVFSFGSVTSVNSHSASSLPTGGPKSNSTMDHMRDITAQIILVSPLCELGTLAALVQGHGKVPMHALPPALQSLLAAAGPLDAAAGDGHDGPPASPPQAGVRMSDLPSAWAEVLKLQVCLQVLDGVEALHTISLIHCDIKPENIFLQSAADFSPFNICAKIGDMDACRSLRTGDQLKPHAFPFSRGSLAHTHFTSAVKGTPGYLAPEMITQGRVSVETDVYSLAITIMVTLSEHPTFQRTDTLHMKMIADYPASIQQELRDVLEACASMQPRQRPSLAAVKAALLRQFQSSSAAVSADSRP